MNMNLWAYKLERYIYITEEYLAVYVVGLLEGNATNTEELLIYDISAKEESARQTMFTISIPSEHHIGNSFFSNWQTIDIHNDKVYMILYKYCRTKFHIHQNDIRDHTQIQNSAKVRIC